MGEWEEQMRKKGNLREKLGSWKQKGGEVDTEGWGKDRDDISG